MRRPPANPSTTPRRLRPARPRRAPGLGAFAPSRRTVNALILGRLRANAPMEGGPLPLERRRDGERALAFAALRRTVNPAILPGLRANAPATGRGPRAARPWFRLILPACERLRRAVGRTPPAGPTHGQP
ncbi:MAG: hypothetical protein U9R72_14240 [Chloroflexota bacterium]|nr:hypothetical protein [Chloroflexota bacterium]